MDTTPTPDHTAASAVAPDAAGRARWLPALGWTAHGVLRIVVAFHLFVYGAAKLVLMQMGRPDFADALVRYGEMSPQGLLWRFMGFSPTVQFIAGLAEVLAAVLLIWGRTAHLGAILGAVDMAVVFGLNLTFDVPVKYLALGLTVGCLLLLLPYVKWLAAVLTGRAAPAPARPRILPWPRAHRVVSVLAAVAAGLVLIGSVAGALVFNTVNKPAEGPLPGVYQVTRDAQQPAAQLAQDTRWQQVAFGQSEEAERGPVSVRYANGQLRRGSYTVDGGTVVVALDQPIQGDLGLMDYETTDEITLSWTSTENGLHLAGEGVDVDLTQDTESRYLFDRDFSWAPRVPVNR